MSLAVATHPERSAVAGTTFQTTRASARILYKLQLLQDRPPVAVLTVASNDLFPGYPASDIAISRAKIGSDSHPMLRTALYEILQKTYIIMVLTGIPAVP
ncbi:hypothetical protein QUC32_05740 [Novosphingobium resinovorum]|uniref:hypothetical protein n=1 Tax=Novosphingobium TaxID=165696 RepID=UPI0012DD75C3|nr:MULTISPECIES: hypothetical protein [Novosphingobium]MBF7014863.1 hypothetical protein [Novosphingobium sp. HR1a]WJM24659.1 hypothetical protein QUC32_05740 [Novosphingobium resinovorum]